ncbi:hypothetical protein BC827DRAFT_863672 [Russula dissimulans]|nr:hypothetical protein BC827DRAFT_863672 [Russula dissimulans]
MLARSSACTTAPASRNPPHPLKPKSWAGSWGPPAWERGGYTGSSPIQSCFCCKPHLHSYTSFPSSERSSGGASRIDSLPRVPVKRGVFISSPSRPTPSKRHSSTWTFGAIDDTPASIPPFPQVMRPVDGVKFFGSVAVQNGGSDPAKSAVTSRPPSSDPSTSSP